MIKLIGTKYMDFKLPPKNLHGVIKDLKVDGQL